MGGGGVAKGVSRCCKQHANRAGVAFLFRKVVKTVSRKKHNKPTGRQRLVPEKGRNGYTLYDWVTRADNKVFKNVKDER